MYDNFLKIVIVTLIIFSANVQVDAQNTEAKEDSLLSKLEDSQGVNRFNILYELCRINVDRDNQVAMNYANQAHKISLSLGDSLLIVKSGRAMGLVQTRLDNLSKAIQNFAKALDIAKRNKYNDQVKFLLNNLALVYTYQANYDKALEYHFQALVIREKDGNKAEMSITYNNIGLVYFKLKDFERALEYFKRSENLKREVHDLYDLDRCLINIGLCYNALSLYNQAIEYFNEALSLCGPNCSRQIITEGHYGLGTSYLETSNVEEAKRQFKISYQAAQKDDNSVFMAENLISLHKLSLIDKNYDSAFSYLQEADRLLSSTNYNELKISLYKSFANFYKLQNNFENVSRYQSKYIQLKDSIYSDQLISNLAKIQSNYEERENIAIIASKEEALTRQKRFNMAVAIIAVLAASLVFVLYRSNQVKKRVNLALSDAKNTIEAQNRQLTTLNRNLEKMVDARTVELQVANESLKRVNDELDNFIYKTSHDIRGPLASLRGMCNVAIMDVNDPLALEYFHKLDATAEKLNTILTRLLIINQINNASAGHELIDFNSIVEDVIILEKKRGLPANLAVKSEIDEGIVFYSDKELIRIILENLIDNAIKFYNDSDRVDPFVQIRIAKEDTMLKISVIDNGIGISQVNPDKIFQIFSRASERSGTGGIGLYLTKTATEKIGGQIELKTTPEGHTEFFVKFSLVTSKMRTEIA